MPLVLQKLSQVFSITILTQVLNNARFRNPATAHSLHSRYSVVIPNEKKGSLIVTLYSNTLLHNSRFVNIWLNDDEGLNK